MDNETLHEVVKKLIGNINPVGETRTDEERFENLKVSCDLAVKILTDIHDMARRNRDMHQFSIKRAVKYVQEFFDELDIPENIL